MESLPSVKWAKFFTIQPLEFNRNCKFQKHPSATHRFFVPSSTEWQAQYTVGSFFTLNPYFATSIQRDIRNPRQLLRKIGGGHFQEFDRTDCILAFQELDIDQLNKALVSRMDGIHWFWLRCFLFFGDPKPQLWAVVVDQVVSARWTSD